MASPNRTLEPIPGSPNPATTSSSRFFGPRPDEGETSLPIPTQLRALLQTRLSITLTDGRILLGTLTSIDSTSLLLNNVEELRDLSTLDAPRSPELGRSAGGAAEGEARLRTSRAQNVAKYYPQSRDGINVGLDAPDTRPEGQESTVRRRELQSILVQFEHCTSITMDEDDWGSWRRYCEMPPELHPTGGARPSKLMMGQVI